MPPIEKACSRCGKKFTCHQEEFYWCADIGVDEAILLGLRKQFADCLCEACLRAACRVERV